MDTSITVSIYYALTRYTQYSDLSAAHALSPWIAFKLNKCTASVNSFFPSPYLIVVAETPLRINISLVIHFQ